jgi:hypothetical protein
LMSVLFQIRTFSTAAEIVNRTALPFPDNEIDEGQCCNYFYLSFPSQHVSASNGRHQVSQLCENCFTVYNVHFFTSHITAIFHDLKYWTL